MDNYYTVLYDGEYRIIESPWLDADIVSRCQICGSFETMEEAAAYIDEALNLN